MARSDPDGRAAGLAVPFLLVVLAQAGHSVEEYAFRLYDLFAPAQTVSELFGIGRRAGFLVVNSLFVLFGLWCWAARVRPGRGAARDLAWLWALVELANGLGHIVLAIAAGGYFPGLATAPLLLAASLWLLSRLAR